MYANIGEKIKGLAVGSFVLLSSLMIGLGILFWIITESFLFAIVVFVGPVIAWISSWLLYAFGDIADNLATIAKNSSQVNGTPICAEKCNSIENQEMVTSEREEATNTDEKEEIVLNKPYQCTCGEMFYGRYCPICGRRAEK